MMTHHVVHESFKNNINNNTHNIAQGATLFSGGQMPPLAPLNATLHIIIVLFNSYTTINAPYNSPFQVLTKVCN